MELLFKKLLVLCYFGCISIFKVQILKPVSAKLVHCHCWHTVACVIKNRLKFNNNISLEN